LDLLSVGNNPTATVGALVYYAADPIRQRHLKSPDLLA
jgi:hypothetical protein